MKIFFCFIVFFALLANAQERNNLKIVSYNVENFFDCVHDSMSNDMEFTPSGMRNWTYSKFKTKQANIAKVITAIGGWDTPGIVGLCEVENRKCLIDLTRYSGLKNLRYKFLHHESPDPRGIDVALLYQPKQFRPIHDEAIPIHFPNSVQSKTRDILFASGIIPTGDTLHVFVCHFPSRLEGELESEEKRFFVASVLRVKVDSLFAATLKPKILIMGDFNDFPTNKSILEVLKANPIIEPIKENRLYNLVYKLHTDGNGSNKHLGDWGALDQIIVSGSLLNQTSSIYTKPEDVHFFDADFLLENDKTYLGKQTFRTFVGMKYQAGFSDHLPVFADFWY